MSEQSGRERADPQARSRVPVRVPFGHVPYRIKRRQASCRLLRASCKLLWSHNNFQRVLARKLAGVRGQSKGKLNLIKRYAMGNEQADRKVTAEDQAGGF